MRFPLSLRNVEGLLHERGSEVSHETIRFWWNRFGPIFAAEIRKKRNGRMRALSGWRWHLDEVFVKIHGERHYLWRAVDQEGEVLEAFVSKKRDRKAALKFLRKLMKRYPRPDAIITDYEYRIDQRGDWISIGSTATTHTIAGLVNGTAYVFQVRAVNRIGRSGPSLPAEATPIAQVVLDLAHFANGAGIISEVVLVNVAPHPIRPALYFYDQEGEPIAAESMVDVLGDLGIQEDGGLTIRTEMEPLGELTISTHGRGELVSGSVRVVSDGPIGGVLRFDLPGIGVAGVGASQPVRDALFPARRQAGGISPGAAIHNLGGGSDGGELPIDERRRRARKKRRSRWRPTDRRPGTSRRCLPVPIHPISWGRCAAPHQRGECSPEWPWNSMPATRSLRPCRWCRFQRGCLRNRRHEGTDSPGLASSDIPWEQP